MSLLPRALNSLIEVSARWGCSIADIVEWLFLAIWRSLLRSRRPAQRPYVFAYGGSCAQRCAADVPPLRGRA